MSKQRLSASLLARAAASLGASGEGAVEDEVVEGAVRNGSPVHVRESAAEVAGVQLKRLKLARQALEALRDLAAKVGVVVQPEHLQVGQGTDALWDSASEAGVDEGKGDKFVKLSNGAWDGAFDCLVEHVNLGDALQITLGIALHELLPVTVAAARVRAKVVALAGCLPGGGPLVAAHAVVDVDPDVAVTNIKTDGVACADVAAARRKRALFGISVACDLGLEAVRAKRLVVSLVARDGHVGALRPDLLGLLGVPAPGQDVFASGQVSGDLHGIHDAVVERTTAVDFGESGNGRDDVLLHGEGVAGPRGAFRESAVVHADGWNGGDDRAGGVNDGLLIPNEFQMVGLEAGLLKVWVGVLVAQAVGETSAVVGSDGPSQLLLGTGFPRGLRGIVDVAHVAAVGAPATAEDSAGRLHRRGTRSAPRHGMPFSAREVGGALIAASDTHGAHAHVAVGGFSGDDHLLVVPSAGGATWAFAGEHAAIGRVGCDAEGARDGDGEHAVGIRGRRKHSKASGCEEKLHG